MTQESDLSRLVEAIAKSHHELKRYVDRLSRAQDAGRTTIHRGAMRVLDEAGNVAQQLGPDGLRPVAGPKPAQPAPAVVEPGENTAKIITDGEDVNGDSAPEDWRRTLIYMSLDSEFEPTEGDFRGSMWDVAGEAVVVSPAGSWWVRLVWETTSGQRSDPSDPVRVDITPPVDTEDLEATLETARGLIAEARAEADETFGEHAENMRQLADSLEAATDDLAEAKQILDPLPGRLEAAEAEATLIRYALEGEDGESGLRGELREAQATLAEKADASQLPELENRLTTAFGEADEAVATAAAADATDKAEAARQDAIDAAEQHADSLPKVLHGTTAPSGTAPNGSIWWQHQGSLSGPVIGQWNRVNGQWRSTPIDSEAIANLDVGKLTAGSAEIAEAVIELLWARVVRAGLLEADEALIGRTVIQNGAVTAEKIEATRELITHILGAEWVYVAEQLVVAGDLITANIEAISASIEGLTVTERADFAKAFAQEMWAELGVFSRLTAEESWITSAMIAELTADKVTVTEDFVASVASILHLVVGEMDVNALWADQAWLAAVEAASVRLRSVIDDWVTILSGRGMEVISPGGEPTVQLGNFEETGLTLYQDGEATASMTDDGHVSGTIVSANEEFYYQGDELGELIDQSHLPGGVVAHYKRWIGNFHEQYVEERGFAEITFPVYPGRSYQIFTNPMTVHSPTSRRIYLQLRREWGSSANLDSLLLARGATETNTSDVGQVSCSTVYQHSADSEEMTMYVLASFYSDAPWMVRGGGGGGFGDLELTAVDLGPTASEGYGYTRNIGKGRFDSGADGPGDTPPAPTPKVRRVKTYGMSWWRTWWQNGNIPSSGVGVKEAAQGRTPYFTTAGTYRSMIGFPSMTSDLSGADIEKIEVRVRVTHSHSGSGGYVRLGTHNRTSRPSSFTGYSNSESTNTHFGRGQEKWVTLPSSLYNGFKNGTYRGVTMYTSSTSSSYYVQANPSRFAIRVTYRK